MMTESDIHDRLRRLGVTRGAGQLKPQPRPRIKGIEELLSGEVMDTPFGSFFLHRETYDLGYRHGSHALADLLDHSLELPSRLVRDERLARVEAEKLAFIDIETTGLAGGTGTYAFLVGVGTFEEGSFALYQFFMRDFHEELPLLSGLAALLDRLGAVVSFNGKSFDLPLLETRFIMTRQQPRLIDAPHLDLLAPSRRIWKHRLASCALSSLEQEVLDVRRTQADLPGWLIPATYIEYVRTGDAQEIVRAFYHNAQDILSLVTLAARLCALLDDLAPPIDELPGEDLYGLGGLLLDLGHADRAESTWVRSAHRCRSPAVREAAMRELAALLKRQERRKEALPWWRELAEAARAVYACEELAKHYEWHEVDLGQALSWTQRAITLAGAWPPTPQRRETLAALRHRQERLAAKLR